MLLRIPMLSEVEQLIEHVDISLNSEILHYFMNDYVVKELPGLIAAHFPVNGAMSISGHSMGGHGALLIAQSNQASYRSVSAFAPICAPLHCPWGEKAFSAYLGPDKETWKAYDTCEILAGAETALPMLVDQGSEDGFLGEQLRPDLLDAVCKEKGFELNLRLHQGYDHSYYFISSFIGEHLAYHAKALAD